MRRVGLYLILGIIFAIISYALLQELSPFNQQKIEELIESKEIEEEDFEKLNNEIDIVIQRGLIFNYLSENAYIVAFCILLSIFCLFVSIHLVLDKIFFKNFYENASHFDALRRGFLLILSIALFIFAKLSRAETYVLILLVIVPIVIEVVIKVYFKKEAVELDKPTERVIRNESKEGKHISYEDALSDLDHVNPEKKFTDRNTSDHEEHS